MPFNINEFRGMLANRGVLRNTNFAVNITPPSSLNEEIVSDIPYMCDSASIPGTMFNTDNYRHKGYGLEEKRPNGMAPEDTTLTFISDSHAKLIKFFDKWGNKVMNTHTDTGAGTERFGYPNEYYGTIELYMYDVDSEKVSTHTFQDCWPTNIGNVQVGWGQNNELVIVPVTFTYRQHLTHLGDESQRGGSYAELDTMTANRNRRIAAIQLVTTPPSATEYAKRLAAL